MSDSEDYVDVLEGDPSAGTLEPARYPAGSEAFMEACRAFVGCPYLEMARLGGLHADVAGVVAWADEEGLLKSQGGFWRIAGRSTGYAGRVVLSGERDGGEPASLPDGGAALKAAIEMHAARILLDPEDPDVGREGAIRLVLERTR